MATQTVNGLTSYVTSTSGNKTYYIPTGALTVDEVAFLATADANAAAASPVTDIETQLKLLTYGGNGQNGWDRFEGYVLMYDSSSDTAVISGSDVPAAGASYTQAEQTAIVDTVNALKHQVNKDRKKVSG